MTQSNEPTISEMNEAIAVFIGFEKVRIGYFGCKDGDPEYDETDWQVANEKWLEKMGIENTGYYVVNVNGNEWYQWCDVEYHTSWDWLMPVVEKIKAIVREEKDSGEKKSLPRWVPIQNELCNVNITNVHYCVYKFIQWYNQQKQKDGDENI